jgi:CRISPR/Cas system-associated endoribonuclease Cas2
MKKLYYVSYDLVKYKDYPKLWEALKALGGKRILESVWFFRHPNTSATAVRDYLKQFIDKDDRLLVIESSASAWNGNVLADPSKG